MFNWIEKKIKEHDKKVIQDYLDKVYHYNIRFMIEDIVELYCNTWDKERAKGLLSALQSLNLDAYSKDEFLRELVFNKLYEADCKQDKGKK